MDFRLQSRNFPVNFDQDWRSSNISLPSLFPEANVPRNLFTVPFTRLTQNSRPPFYVRNQRRIRPRRRLNLNEMRNSLRRFRHEMYQADRDLEYARDDLDDIKMRLQIANRDVKETKNNLRSAIMKLHQTMNEFSSPVVFNALTLREKNSLQQDLEDVRQDIEEAKARVREAESNVDANDLARFPRQEANTADILVTGVKRNQPADGLELDVNGNATNNENDRCADNNSCCSVCMENPINSVLYTCGHMCICFLCATKLLRRRGDSRRCPMCRAVIRDVIKIYKS